MVRLHPRPFAIAVAGAAVFALCTVRRAWPCSWVIDNVIVPRFDEGHVDRWRPCVAGVGADHRRRRAAGGGGRRAPDVGRHHPVARRRDARAEGVVDRLVRQPISWHQRRPDGDLVARAGVDTDAAIAVLAPDPVRHRRRCC